MEYIFSRETIGLLKKMGYKYIVVDESLLIAYARFELSPTENLDFLGLKQFHIDSIGKRIDFDNCEIKQIVATETSH